MTAKTSTESAQSDVASATGTADTQLGEQTRSAVESNGSLPDSESASGPVGKTKGKPLFTLAERLAAG